MEIQKFNKQEIALRQIETALGLFLAQGDLFSVITLAGAAEEILGQLLAFQKGGQGLAGKLASIFDILRPRSRKGEDREASARHESEVFIHMDAHHEAVFLLTRAIEDYVELTGKPSPRMLKFLNEVAGAK